MALYLHRFSGHTAAGENWMFTWHANSVRDLAGANTAAVDWATALWTGASAGTGYGDHVTTASGFDGVSTVELTPATGIQVQRADAIVNMPGTSAANPMPADVALVVSLRTATSGRSYRGRFYLPTPVVTDSDVTGRVAIALDGDLRGSLTAAWTGYNTVDDYPVVYSRTLHIATQVTSFDVGDLFDTQRRRENKLAENRVSTDMP